MTARKTKTDADTIQAYEVFREQVAQLEADNTQTFDYETPAGNRAARSHVHRMRLIKGRVDAVRKAEKAESLAYGRRVDAQAKELMSKLDGFIQVHAEPLRELEQRAAERAAALRARLDYFTSAAAAFDEDGDPYGSNYLLSELAAVRAVELDDSWGEFLAEAGQAKDAAITALEKHVAAVVKREEEAAELERLRQEREAAAKREEERRIAEAAAARAREEAEVAARKEKEAHARAMREAQERAEQERQEAARKLKEQQEAAARRELELELEAERKERVRLAEEERARKVIEARERDEEHRARVHFEILEALVKAGGGGAWAKPVVDALAAGQIPHVTITY